MNYSLWLPWPQSDIQAGTRTGPRQEFLCKVAGSLAVLFVLHLILRHLMRAADIRLGAVSPSTVPLYAYARVHLDAWLLPCLLWLAGLVAVVRKTGILSSWRPSSFAASLWILSLGTSVTVALIDGGPQRLVAPYERTDLEYAGAALLITDPHQFLRAFPERNADLPMHARNHPPGAVLLLWAVTLLTGPSISAMAGATIAMGSLLPLVLYVWARLLYSELTARQLALLFSCVPSVVLFTCTSLDIVFALPLTLAMYSATRAAACRRSTWLWCALCGIALGGGSLLTYSVALAASWCLLLGGLQTWPWYSGSHRGWGRLLAWVLLPLGLCAVNALAAAIGYRPLDTFRACVQAHHEIMAGMRHETALRWAGLAFGNLGAFSMGIGVALLAATWSSLSRWKSYGKLERSLLVSTIGTLLCGAMSPIYTMEVERSWMFLVGPVILCVGAYLERIPEVSERWRVWRLCAWLSTLQTVATEIVLETYW
jgi:4-amino-4-deoxy-L-arabinose transferase-like glycosyltransferase